MPRKKPPEFLGRVKLTKKHRKAADRILSNWIKTHDYIKKLPPHKGSITAVKRLIAAEYGRKDGPRMDMIARLFGRYKSLRNEIERRQL